MIEGLLQTKIHIPQERPFLVARPRLFEKLNAGLPGAVTIVAAPAGFGKTTLVVQWIRHEAHSPTMKSKPAAAWLSLDEHDNDPVRFLSYMIASLKPVLDNVGDTSLTMLRAPQTPSAEAIITPLINDLHGVPEPFLLVLDDYHEIKERRVHEMMSFLLGHIPPQLHLVLLSRSDPPLPLARLRGQGALNEIRQDDLGFTTGESGEFLNEILDLDLSAVDLDRLNRRTEGWPAGLQMAAVSLQQREDRTEFIKTLDGSNRFILDYLMEEVLARQPEEIQQFLLLTSILERLNGSLCAYLLSAVPDYSGADASILDYLDAANLFIVPLDDQRHWYRYHHLFGDLLLSRLQKTTPHKISLLHARARDWYWEEGWPAEAVAHALHAGDEEKAVQMIEAAAETALRNSQNQTVVRWVQSLPDFEPEEYPRLSIYYAWAQLLSGGSIGEAEDLLFRPVAAGSAQLPAALLMEAFQAAMRNQMKEVRSLAEKALEALGPLDHFWRSVAYWLLSIAANAPTADQSAGDMSWQEASRAAEESGNILVMVSAMCEQGHAQKRQGQLHQARDLFEQALDLATPDGERPLPIAGEALMGMAEIDLEWYRLESADLLLAEGIALTRLWREIATLPGYLQLARLRQAQGDQDGADAALREAARLAIIFDATDLDDVIVAAQQAHLSIRQGRLNLAQSWADDRGLGGTGSRKEGTRRDKALRSYEWLVLARLWVERGELEPALDLLDRILEIFAAWPHTRLAIETQLLRAQTFSLLEKRDQAFKALQQALILGEPGGFVWSFAQEGEPLLHLLRNLAAQTQGSNAYLTTLMEAFGSGDDSTVAPLQGQPLIEPLTERELEILQLIAEGLSNREIGQQLFLSLPTVKWHTSNIYGKLGVKNRTTAVARARELHMLPRQ